MSSVTYCYLKQLESWMLAEGKFGKFKIINVVFVKIDSWPTHDKINHNLQVSHFNIKLTHFFLMNEPCIPLLKYFLLSGQKMKELICVYYDLTQRVHCA